MMLAELLSDISLTPSQAAIELQDLRLDSRQLTSGCGFVALPGASVDGRRFIEAALAADVACVLAEADGLAPEWQANEGVVAVAGLKARLGELAARLYGTATAETLLLGVTGTNGKTSVAWFLRDALNAVGQDCALVGTLGMQFAASSVDSGHTTPDLLTLHRVLADFRKQGAKACAMEVSSHALAQGRVDGLPIRLGIFTNLSRDHLDYHGSMEDYLAAKAALFARDEIELAVINHDDAGGRQLLAQLPTGLRCVTFGESSEAEVRALSCQPDNHGMTLTLSLGGQELSCRLPLFGRFNLSNLLAVAASLHGLGHEAAAIEQALAAITPVPGRMQPLLAEQGPTVLVDYAHTPDGVEKALQAARQHFGGKLWCVVGCGGNRDQGKRPLMAAAAERLADRLMLTSDNPRDEEPEAILDQMQAGLTTPAAALREVDRELAIDRVIKQADECDLVLICGKGHETWQEVRGHKLPMDDRLLARAALAARAHQTRPGGARCD